MRTFFNFLTIIFVLGTVYAVLETNNFSNLVQKFRQAGTEFSQLVHLPEGFTTSETSTVNEGSLVTTNGETAPVAEKKTIPLAKNIAKIVLPGPLVKTEAETVKPSTVATPDGAFTVAGIISFTNIERQKDLLGKLSESYELDASAQVKANDILKRQYFEHTAPDGKTVGDLASAEGYSYIKIGENLALGNFTGDSDVVRAWMASPGHRANILDTDYGQIGVGVASGMYEGRFVYVAVQHFGRPLSACPVVSAILKTKVENGQEELNDTALLLENLKKVIDQGKAENRNVNDVIEIYNQGVEKYQIKYAEIDAARKVYNLEVSDFNNCLAKVR